MTGGLRCRKSAVENCAHRKPGACLIAHTQWLTLLNQETDLTRALIHGRRRFQVYLPPLTLHNPLTDLRRRFPFAVFGI
jgi:hypothetical protein